MKFFIDTANLEEIKEAASYGILDGVTTNPTLISRENAPLREHLKAICDIVPGPVNGEVIGLKADEMIREGKELVTIAPNICVKIPMTLEGLKAVKVLEGEDISCNVTLVFSAMQALMAAKAGASYVSPFVGRLDDISHIGMDLIRDIVEIYDNYGYNTEVIVASIRNPVHVYEAALAGAHISTIPLKVINQLVKHPLTDRGIESFLKDWEKVPK